MPDLEQWTYEPGDAKSSVTPTFEAWEETARNAHPPFVSRRNDPVRWTPLAKAPSACRVALVTTGGVHRRDQKPFDAGAHEGDWSIRRISKDASPSDLMVTHTHYNHGDADDDINCMLPLDPLNELASEGLVGSVAQTHFGLMGFVPDPRPLLAETVPVLVDELRSDEIDVVIFSPG